jgi:hypothetical protein
MTSDEERKAITTAMQRLFAGKPLRSSGELTIVALAAEAGLKLNKLTHKHVDLKDLFNAECRARLGIPDSELKLREQIDQLKGREAELRAERYDYRTASETHPEPSTSSPSRTTTFARKSKSTVPPRSALSPHDVSHRAIPTLTGADLAGAVRDRRSVLRGTPTGPIRR